MPTGLTRDAGWEIGVSRSLPVTIDEAWTFLVSDHGVALWLGAGAALPDHPKEPIATADGGSGELRSFRPLDRVRIRWQPGGWDHPTIVQCTVSGGTARTTIRFHQEHLADSTERERQRSHWRAVMDRVEEALG
jgi:uncharacterized protein YndB with AHSA1/START domain